MSDAVIIEIVKIVGMLASLVISGFISFRLGKLSHHINSRMDQLLLETQKASRAEGKVEGKAEERNQIVEALPSTDTKLKITGGEIKITGETKKK